MLLDVVRSGDRRKSLEGLRDLLAAAIDDGPAHKDLPGLVLRLERVLADLDSLSGPVGKESVDDALAARRRARQAASG